MRELLQGLALYRLGLVANADSMIQQAARGITEAERCAWNGIAMPRAAARR